MLADLTIPQIVMRLLAMVIVAGIHGAAVARAAVLLGDAGPRYDGRTTLLPSAHLDVFGTIAAVAFGMGWTRPVAIDTSSLRSGRAGLVLVVLAGTVALGLAAIAMLALVRPALEALSYGAGIWVAAALRSGAQLCLWTALFNLLPVPPLTGAHLLGAIGLKVPKQAVWVATAALLVLLASGVARMLLTPAYDLIAPSVLGGAL